MIPEKIAGCVLSYPEVKAKSIFAFVMEEFVYFVFEQDDRGVRGMTIDCCCPSALQYDSDFGMTHRHFQENVKNGAEITLEYDKAVLGIRKRLRLVA